MSILTRPMRRALLWLMAGWYDERAELQKATEGRRKLAAADRHLRDAALRADAARARARMLGH